MSCRQAAGRGGRGSGGWWRPRRKEGCRAAGSARRSGRGKAKGELSTAMAAAQATAQRAAAGVGAGSQSSCLCVADAVDSAGAAVVASVGTGANASNPCSGCTNAASVTAKARNALRTTAPFIAKMTGIFTAPLHHAHDRRERNSSARGTRLSRGAGDLGAAVLAAAVAVSGNSGPFHDPQKTRTAGRWGPAGCRILRFR